jgi:hypothetical protein
VKTFIIATGGIRAGKLVPLELAVDGLLTIPDEQPNFEALGGVWVFPTMPRPIALPQRRDAVVEVKGCRMKASTAKPTVKVSTSINVVGCREENELEILMLAQVALEEFLLDEIVENYADEAPFAGVSNQELLSRELEDLRDEVASLQAEVKRLRRHGCCCWNYRGPAARFSGCRRHGPHARQERGLAGF